MSLMLIGRTATLARKWRKYKRRHEAKDTHTITDIISKFTAPPAVLLGSSLGYLVSELTNNPKLANISRHAALNSAVASGTTYIIKRIIGRERPGVDGPTSDLHGPTLKDDHLSFPSGHVSAISGAAFALPKSTHPWLLAASAGYLAIAASGVARIRKKRHFFTDVLAGAGIGLLSAKLVEHFDPPEEENS